MGLKIIKVLKFNYTFNWLRKLNQITNSKKTIVKYQKNIIEWFQRQFL